MSDEIRQAIARDMRRPRAKAQAQERRRAIITGEYLVGVVAPALILTAMKLP